MAFHTQGGTLRRRTAFGHFELLEELGAGAFGVVWKARDTKLDRIVALKIPRRGQLTTEETEKFVREARNTAQVRHPHIVSVHEVGFEGETIFIVSDFVDGVSLHDHLSAKRYTPAEAADLCATIAEAMHHAHERGVIHRDLKPGNILLDKSGQPHITDFGLAKRESGEITMTLDGEILGAPAYMSPEQARGEGHHVDRRSDVYSLGVILFQLLTAELPFRGNFRMLLKQVMEDEPPKPRKLNHKLPQDLETICLKCLDKQPAKRYATGGELAEDLRWHLRGDSIRARSAGRLERGWRWCRRNPAVAGWGSGLTLSLALCVTVYVYLWNRHSAAIPSSRTDTTLGRVSKDKPTEPVSPSRPSRTTIPGKEERPAKLDHPNGYPFAQDAEVAQRVLGIGGRIGISTGRALPSLVGAVPEEQFRLLLVDLSSNTKRQPADLSRLKDLGAIQVCSLAYGQASNECLAEIQALRQLWFLNLWACPVGDEACKFLAKLKSLQWLNLGDTGISYAGLHELESLPGLRILHLEKIRRADCGLEPLVKLQGLESLSLWQSEVNDDDLAPVSQLSNLRHLQLGQTKITDAGLAKLTTLKKLEILNVEQTPVSPSAIQQFRLAVPGCQIISTNTPLPEAPLDRWMYDPSLPPRRRAV